MAEFSSLNGYGVKDPTARQSATDERAARIAADNDLQQQISAIANPSPQAVSSTSQMTDTTKIYVNTTDGYWYYYNGTAWTQGGVWQSQAIANNSVSPEKTTYYKRTSNLFNRFNYNHIGGYPTPSNEIAINSATQAASHAVALPCQPNTTYHLRARYTNKFRVACTAVYPENGTPCTNYVDADSNPNITYTTTQNAAYIVLFFYNSNAQPNLSLTQIEETLMISEGETQNYYEPYAYVDVNSVTEDGSISARKIRDQFVMVYKGQIFVDYSTRKIKFSPDLTDLVNETIDKRYPINQGLGSEFSVPNDSRLYALTATVEDDTVTSIQVELYYERDVQNKIILLVDMGTKTYGTPYGYGNSVTSVARTALLYRGTLYIDDANGRIVFTNPGLVLGEPYGYVNAQIPQDLPLTYDLPSDPYLYAVTATMDNGVVSSINFEHYQRVKPESYVIAWVRGTGSSDRDFMVPFDTGGRVFNSLSDKTPATGYAALTMFNRIAAIGDSYTNGSLYYNGQSYTSPGKKLSYIACMGRRNGTDWNNYGIGGITTRGYLTNPNGMAAVLAGPKADLYYLALGINDANQLGTSYLGTIDDITEDYTQNPDTFYGNYARIIEQLQSYAPYAKLIMVGCMRPNSMNVNYGVFSAAIREIAEHYHIPFINPYDDSFFTSNIMSALSGNHPTAAGYTGIALALERLTSLAIELNPNYFKDADYGSVVS